MVRVQGSLHLLKYVEEIDRLVLLSIPEARGELREKLPVVLETIGEGHEDEPRSCGEKTFELPLQLVLQGLLLRLRHPPEADRLEALTVLRVEAHRAAADLPTPS